MQFFFENYMSPILNPDLNLTDSKNKIWLVVARTLHSVSRM